MKEIRVGNRARIRMEEGHVWIYAAEIEVGQISAEDRAVVVRDPAGRLLGSALVEQGSPIPLRMYSRKAEPFTSELVRQRLEQAKTWRDQVLATGTEAYRLVFSEGDRLPGLIVDRYGDSYAVQLGMSGYEAFEATLVEVLQDVCGAKRVVIERGGQRRLALGSDGMASYEMNGLEWQVNLLSGQKTGTFLDQRENYARVSEWAKRTGKCEGRGLDLFTNIGGFGLHLGKQGMGVEAIDRSREAIDTLEENARRNGIQSVRGIQSDVKSYLYSGMQAKRRFDVVVVDPPAFAKSKQHREEGLRGYFELNRGAMRLLNGDGLIACFSCSHHVSGEELLSVARSAAGETRKDLRVLEKLEQSIDHTQLLQVPETHYLKGFILQARPA